jgi:hypothetical protein
VLFGIGSADLEGWSARITFELVIVEGKRVTLGLARRQGDLLDDLTRFCGEAVGDGSIYGLLHRERDRLFPDAMFADLYTDRGRRSVPPSVLACVMVLQRLEGCSDREATDRFTFDARWRYACGVGGWQQEPTSFVHTVLVRTRMRLRASGDPDRVFRVSKQVAAEAGLVGVRRVLDSAPLFDAVATMDTVTLIRSAIRGVLRAADGELAGEVRAVLARDDDYGVAGKPACDWDDAAARELLIDALVCDGLAVLTLLDGRELAAPVAEAAELLAVVVGQDTKADADGRFRIVRGVAADRVISTVDPDARHGHKTSARGFDGYKGHAAMDPDSEIVTGAAAGPAGGGDAAMTDELLDDMVTGEHTTDTGDRDGGDGGEHARGGNASDGDGDGESPRPAVYGDAAYGSGDNLARLAQVGAKPMVKVQPANAPGGRFSKDDFDIDLAKHTVTCPAGHTAAIPDRDADKVAVRFADHCTDCPLRPQCTTAAAGRTITIGRHEQRLQAARARQQDPAWQADYRATRPKVERKLAHLLRRRHGGRRVRMRGLRRVDQDWKLLAGAVNLARLATLGVRWTPTGWTTTPATS